VSTFGELFEQAEQDIRATLRSSVSDVTNYYVTQGSVLLASVRLWAQLYEKTDADVQAKIDHADRSSLEKVVGDLTESGDSEALMAGQLLQAIANRPQPFVSETAHCASRAFVHWKSDGRSPTSRAMPGEFITDQGVVTARASVHWSLFVHAGRRDERRSVRSIYDHVLVLPAG
jgi:hypothetical protein